MDNIPEGKLIRTIHGGEDTLKKTLLKLKEYEFTGYVKSTVFRENMMSEGYLFIKDGMPVASVYGRNQDDTFISTKQGEKAVKLIWVDSYDKTCKIEVMGRVDVNDFLKSNPEASFSLFGKPVKPKPGATEMKPAPSPTSSVKPEMESKLAPMKDQIQRWKSSGYVVYSLEDAMEESVDEATNLYNEFSDNIKRIEYFKDSLRSMETKGQEHLLKKVEAMFRNPLKMTAIEAAMEEVSEQIALKKKEQAERLKAIEEERKMQAHKIKEPVPLPERPAAFSPAVSKPSEVFAAHHEDTGLDADMTFSNFVVGENNRFSQAAALAVAKAQSTVYNPLVIMSGPGLGITHLLNAIGNFVFQNYKDKNVVFVTTERFAQEFKDAADSSTQKEFRNKYREVDFFLLDDIQILAKHLDVQDELYHTFNTLFREGKQIVVGTSKPIREISGLNERFLALFDSGLVTEMTIPDLDTRVAILEHRAKMTGLDIESDILREIAKRYVSSIRALEGALNKVVAYCDLMDVIPSLFVVDEVLKDVVDFTGIEEPEVQLIIEETPTEKMKKSHSYLIEEDRPSKCFEMFAEMVEYGSVGMAITRINPKRLKEKYEFGDADLYWLTDRESSEVQTMEPTLERIIYKIEDLLNTSKNPVLLIDGLEYLISNTSFDAVLRFLRQLIDEVSESSGIFLMSLTPEILGAQELKVLEREMEVISFK